MGVVELVAVLLLLVAAAGWAAGKFAGHLTWRRLLARRVVVNLKTGRAVDGLLVKRSGDLLVLHNATAYEPGADPVKLDGSAVIARADVDFIQTL